MGSRNIGQGALARSLRVDLDDQVSAGRGAAESFVSILGTPSTEPSVARPRLSVIIPVYNEVQNLEKLVAKVLNVPIDKEVVIVDDGSTDGTSDLKARVAAMGPRITWLTHAKNQGKGAGIRTGLGHASGEILIVQDADPNTTRTTSCRCCEVRRPFRARGLRIALRERRSGAFIWHWFVTSISAHYEIRYCIISRHPRAEPAVERCIAPTSPMKRCYKAFRREVLDKFELKCTGFEFCPE